MSNESKLSTQGDQTQRRDHLSHPDPHATGAPDGLPSHQIGTPPVTGARESTLYLPATDELGYGVRLLNAASIE